MVVGGYIKNPLVAVEDGSKGKERKTMPTNVTR